MSKKVTQKNKVKVLYQNLGGIWYAFAQNGEEVYFGRVPLNTAPAKALKILKAQSQATDSENNADQRQANGSTPKSAA